jgi:phosphate transport system substrate-binding protein
MTPNTTPSIVRIVKPARLAAGLLLASALLAGLAADDLKTLKGTVRIDGSSTVFPIMEAVAEEFSKTAPGVKVPVGVSGTGGGFKRFCVGETEVSSASRPISPSEVELAATNKVEFIELPIAYDALSIVVNPKNDWMKQVTIAQLKTIFSEGGAKTWKDIDPSWPDRPMRVFSPGTDSGTFDYFKEAVIGKEGSVRRDVSVSEDDNVLVIGVSGDKDAIGFFGLAYFTENKDKLRAVPVVGKSGASVAPEASTVADGSYPLARPLFLYVSAKAAATPETAALIDFTLAKASEVVEEVGYVLLPGQFVERASANWKARKTGTAFVKDGAKVEGTFSTLYK